MKLYIIVYEILDGGPDWFLWARSSYPKAKEMRNKIEDHIREAYDCDEDYKFDFHNIIDNYWYEEITGQDYNGYKLTLNKAKK